MSKKAKARDDESMRAAIDALREAFPLFHPDFRRSAWRKEFACGDTRLADYYEWLVHQIESDGQRIDKAASNRRLHIDMMARDLEGAFAPEHPDYSRQAHAAAPQRATFRENKFPVDYWKGCFLALEDQGRTPEDFATMLAAYRLARAEAGAFDQAARVPLADEHAAPRL